MIVKINGKKEKETALQNTLGKIKEIKEKKYFDLVIEKENNIWIQIFKENGSISISKKEENKNSILYKLPENIEIENIVKDFYEDKQNVKLFWDEETIEKTKNGKTKWYFQSTDYKIHAIMNVKGLKEILSSEKQMALFFEDKICLGCQIRKDFIEIIFDEKRIRISFNGKDKFIDFKDYTDLLEIFDKEYRKIENSKKKKKSLSDKLSFIGAIIVFSMIIVFIIFNNLHSISNIYYYVLVIILGFGMLLTFPKALEEYRKEENNYSVSTRGLLLSVFGGILVIAGIYMLIK